MRVQYHKQRNGYKKLITESGYIFIQLCNSYLQKWGRRKGEKVPVSERVLSLETRE